MTDNFSVKQLQASITINPSSTTPTFNGSSSNTVTFGGAGQNAVRMRADLHNAGGMFGEFDLTVWGLPLSIMNQLSTYGQQMNLLPNNQITIFAGDGNGPLKQAYVGAIIGSEIDFDQPNAAMHLAGNTAAAFSAGSAQPQSYNGSVDVATVLQKIASAMGLSFENNGVSVQLSNVYLYGSLRDQYTEIVQHADIYATIDRGVMAIWPKFKNRNGSGIQISPDDGTMIGYPAYTATGVSLRALYNPSFAIGRQVTVTGSQITPVNATWNIYSVNHMLESQTPGGKWESFLMVTSPKFPTPLV